MTRIDWFVLKRVGSRVLATLLVLFCLIFLVEMTDSGRFTGVMGEHGLATAILMVLASAGRWTIKTLPVTVLLGAIIGIIDLKARHELTVIKSSGLSFWRIIRAPAIALFLATLALTAIAETVTTSIIRELAPMPPGEATLLVPRGEIWLDERGGLDRHVMVARSMEPGGSVLNEVVVFPMGPDGAERIEGPQARLENGAWVIDAAVLYTVSAAPQAIGEYRVTTSSTPTEIELKLTSIEDVTFFELGELIASGVADPGVAAAALTRFVKLLSMPLILVGSLLIAFAFTAGYRRSDRYGPSVLYGMVLGFIVFVVSEMSERAGAGGVLNPVFAALGPAFVAIVIGLTVLLYKEDGRA